MCLVWTGFESGKSRRDVIQSYLQKCLFYFRYFSTDVYIG